MRLDRMSCRFESSRLTLLMSGAFTSPGAAGILLAEWLSWNAGSNAMFSMASQRETAPVGGKCIVNKDIKDSLKAQVNVNDKHSPIC